jgi:hypothetical protein
MAPRPRLTSPASSASPPTRFEAIATALNAAIAAGLAFHLARELASPRELAGTDFTVFRTGWSLILSGHGRELYDVTAQSRVQAALLGEVGSPGFRGGLMAFLHPPQAALAGCPLGWLADRFGEPLAFRFWTACSLLVLVLLIRAVRRELRTERGGTIAVALALAAFYPVFETLQQGQVSLLLALAMLGAVTAVGERRALAAAAWLVVLGIKPQTLPALLVVLAIRREGRVLALAALLGGAAAAVAALVLGPGVWADYLRALPGLERFFGTGTPEYMPTVRGLLARLFGSGAAVDRAALAAWAVAIVAAGIAAARTRRAPDGRAAYAFALSAGALASPHLFPQDLLLWVAPVTLVLALGPERSVALPREASEGARGAGAPRQIDRLRSRIVLAWPLWFVLARALDVRDAPRPQLPFDLVLVPLALATAWAAKEAWRGTTA